MAEMEARAVEHRTARAATNHVFIAGVILAVFWGALLYDYWPAIVPAALRVFNNARSVGAETLEHPYFEVRNNSYAGEDQVREMLQKFEQQYQAIGAYTQTTPSKKIQVLMVNGSGPALVDGTQIVISYDNGLTDNELVPLYLAVLIQDIPIDPASGLVPGGGQSLQVVERAGFGEGLIRQPLDAWVVLLRQNDAYLPLDAAWAVTMPNDENSYYLFIRAVLESGSFMGWFTRQYGLEAAQRVARGEGIDVVSGTSLAQNEAAWLRWLDQKNIQPQPCEEAIPQDHIFRLICRKLAE